MKNSSPLLPQSPVNFIRGIGDVKAKALAELDIYSIQDFLEQSETEDDILRIAGKTGMKANNILELRDFVKEELQKLQSVSAGRRGLYKRILLNVLWGLFNVLIVAIGVIIEATSYHQFHHPSYNATILFQEPPPTVLSSYSMRVFSTYTGINARTEILIEDRLDLCFANDSLSNIPEGILFHMLTRSELRNAQASFYIIEQKIKQVEPGWVTLEEVGKISYPLAINIEDVSQLENFPGINTIIWIDKSALADIQATLESIRNFECHFEFSAEFIDNVEAIFFDPYRKGIISVLSFIYYNEAIYFGIIDSPDDGLGPLLQLEILETSDGSGRIIEYFWVPDQDGEFIRPDDLIGARQFYEIEYVDPIETSFSFRTEGAQWLPYLAGIVGIQMLIGTVQYTRTRLKRAR